VCLGENTAELLDFLNLCLDIFQWLESDLHRFALVIYFKNPDKLGAEGKHLLSEGYDDELGILSSFLYKFTHYGYVVEVQGSINFVHEIKRGWFVVVQSENKSQAGNCFLSTA
jgi:hypothetical protein